jgi:hypothetical protein
MFALALTIAFANDSVAGFSTVALEFEDFNNDKTPTDKTIAAVKITFNMASNF